jgi:hypothetical protein
MGFYASLKYLWEKIMFRTRVLVERETDILCVVHFLRKPYNIFLLVYRGVESNWIHSALRPPIGLLCQPRVIMMMEKLVEWLAKETEVLGENLPQCPFAHHKPHMPTRTWTRAVAVGSQRLTAWATARP